MTIRLRSFAPAALVVLAGCVISDPIPVRAYEAEVANAELAFADAAAREGIRDAFVRFSGDSSVAFRPEPENAKAAWRSRPPVPGRLRWYPAYVRAAGSGDLGLTTGPYESRDSTGALRGTGTYFTVWRRDAEGWRFMVDQGIRHAAPAEPPARWDVSMARFDRIGRRYPTGPVARDLLAADRRFAARAEEAGFAAALRRFGHPEMRLLRDGAFPHVGLDSAVAAASADGARRYSATPARAYAAAAGDFGWTWGEYRLLNAGAGRRETGHYVHVWVREGHGPWRLLVDVTAPRPPERDE
ncbi:MAG TPA: hypothetical protein VF092_25185 [Longimicrobium sp.]